MPKLEELKRRIEETRHGRGQKGTESPEEKIDPKQVNSIVERLQKKYGKKQDGYGDVKGRLRELKRIIEPSSPRRRDGEPEIRIAELRKIIVEGEDAKINIQTVEELQDFQSPVIKQLGKFYLAFRGLLEPIAGAIRNMQIAADTRYYLYSADMKFSINQWLALMASTSAIALVFVFAVMAAVSAIYKLPQTYSILLAIVAGMLTFTIMLLIPKSMAQRRGNAISVELPFALRHMSTELKAGIGLYKTIQTIANADYGVLSEEFSRTVAEIEEGTDAKDALYHFAMRTQSKALCNSLLHIVRALKTGGNLSEIMGLIAEDVSFDLRIRIKDYSEKMNFFGVIYIFIAIVAPVFLAIIGSILNAPVSLGDVSIPPLVIAIVFMVAMPFILGFLILYLKMTQPKV